MSTEWIYGFHAVTTVLRSRPSDIQSLLLDAQRNDGRVKSLIAVAQEHGITVERVPRSRLDAIIPDGRSQGVAAEVLLGTAQGESALIDLLDGLEGPPFLLILDGVQDPHNLGACLRTAEAAGVDAVIAPKDRAVGLTATVRKVAAGAVERVPFFQVTNLARTLRGLKEQGVWLVGLAGDGEKSVYETSLTGPLAVVMGAEGSGLRRLTAELCDFKVHIPMVGGTESVNVSVATGIALFEAVRQRRFASR